MPQETAGSLLDASAVLRVTFICTSTLHQHSHCTQPYLSTPNVMGDLMCELQVPTFHVWDVVKPQCDGWCDYPVANRPNAIMQFFRAAAKDRSLIKGAWIMMTECDYVWMKPAKVWSGGPGWQYRYYQAGMLVVPLSHAHTIAGHI